MTDQPIELGPAIRVQRHGKNQTAIVLEHANHGLAGGVGGALAVCAVLIGGVVGRPRMAWALLAGTVLQLLVIAAGVVVPAMYILGIIFAALWVTGIWLARRVTPRPDAS